MGEGGLGWQVARMALLSYTVPNKALVLTTSPFSPLQTHEFLTFDVNKLTSINISSAGSPATPVTYNFEQGHRHTLLVWGPSHYRVVSSWASAANS